MRNRADRDTVALVGTRLYTAAAATAVILGLLAPSAGASTRYVSTTGVIGGLCLTTETACTLSWALVGGGSVADDTVEIAPGTYDLDDAPIVLRHRLTIRGRAGERPLLRSTSAGDVARFSVDTAGTKLTDLSFESEARPALTIVAPSQVARIDVESGAAGKPALAIRNSTLSDSLVRTTGAGATAVEIPSGAVRNVTAVATGSGSTGIRTSAGPDLADPGEVTIANSVVRAAGTDVVVDDPGPVATVSHSNFRTLSGTIDPAGTGNADADPAFADEAAGDYRPAEALIDAGADSDDNGPTDLAGRPRRSGTAVDVGAYEYQWPAVPDPSPSGDTTTGTGAGTTPADAAPASPGLPTPRTPITPADALDRIAPGLSALSLTNRSFAVGTGSTPITLARARKGTVFSYRLTEPGGVGVVIALTSPGRVSGSRCVKPTKRNAKAKRCTRYTAKGNLRRMGTAGKNALPFTGRIGSKALKPGRYRASFLAADAAGNASAIRSVSFTVVKR